MDACSHASHLALGRRFLRFFGLLLGCSLSGGLFFQIIVKVDLDLWRGVVLGHVVSLFWRDVLCRRSRGVVTSLVASELRDVMRRRRVKRRREPRSSTDASAPLCRRGGPWLQSGLQSAAQALAETAALRRPLEPLHRPMELALPLRAPSGAAWPLVAVPRAPTTEQSNSPALLFYCVYEDELGKHSSASSLIDLANCHVAD